MQSVLNNEMEIFWSRYKKIIKKQGVKTFLERSTPTLKKVLTIEYKSLFQDAKVKAKKAGKTRSQISYCCLKLRRLIALWDSEGVLCGNYKISYKHDQYNKFPLFDRQNFNVVPTTKTIEKIKINLLNDIVKKYNKEVLKAQKIGNTKNKPITNLCELRTFLIFKMGIKPSAVPELMRLYKDQTAKADKGFAAGIKLI